MKAVHTGKDIKLLVKKCFETFLAFVAGVNLKCIDFLSYEVIVSRIMHLKSNCPLGF
jgi:hypothetical protein